MTTGVKISDRKGEGENTSRQHLCLAMEIEGHTMPSVYRRNHLELKDHMKENMRRIRQIQKGNLLKESTCQPVKPLWKLAKFEHVESRVKEQLQKEPSAPRPYSAGFLRAHSRTGYLPQSARPASVEPPEDKLTVPKASTARDVQLVRHEVNFLKINSLSAKKPPTLRRSASVSALDTLRQHQEDKDKTYKKGEMPKYLIERKKQWEQQRKEWEANQRDPDMPDGHRLMSDEERQNTLERIKQKQKELIAELSSMPIRNDTLRIRTKRDELEQNLVKMEEAIKIFSRPKVFVKLDS